MADEQLDKLFMECLAVYQPHARIMRGVNRELLKGSVESPTDCLDLNGMLNRRLDRKQSLFCYFFPRGRYEQCGFPTKFMPCEVTAAYNVDVYELERHVNEFNRLDNLPIRGSADPIPFATSIDTAFHEDQYTRVIDTQSTTRVSITFPAVNYTIVDDRQNVTLTDTATVLSEDFGNDGSQDDIQLILNDRASAPTSDPDEESSPLPDDMVVPKVALLFLSHKELHNEPIWIAFFEAAERLSFRVQPPNRPPRSYVYGYGEELFEIIQADSKRRLRQSESMHNIMACDSEPDYLAAEVPRLMNGNDRDRDIISSQKLFSVYTHPAPGYFFPDSSIFHGTEVENRIDTAHAWASFALVSAEKLLVKTALNDPNNIRFILLSESCIPLHRPELIYLQVISETKSRLNACNPWGKKIMLERWDGHMKTNYLDASNWRKSSQWFCLTRSHAEIIAEDKHVAAKFRAYCRVSSKHRCVPDEHYIPTALAVYGVDTETDCIGGVTATVWPTSGRSHPVTFSSKNINAILFKKLRHMWQCQVGTAQSSTRHVFSTKLVRERCLFFNGSASAAKDLDSHENWVLGSGYKPLGYGCPMFARKFSRNTVKVTLKTALSCSGGALGYWC